MKRIITLVSAAGAAGLMLLSTSARADRDHDEGRYAQRYDQRDDGWRNRDGGWRDRDDGYRRQQAEWREHEWRELQQQRRAFYASWNGNPWSRARFERWYHRRAEQLRERW